MRDTSEELKSWSDQGLLRQLRHVSSPQGTEISLDGQEGPVLNFSSNDYLGLANDPEVVERFRENLQRYGAGSGASRLVCGNLSPHLVLEEKIAAFKKSESALCFSSGFAAATGTIPALCEKGDIIILDKLCHASLIDGSRLSGATLRVFPHNDTDRLAHMAKWASEKVNPEKGRILIVAESIYSMDGDMAPLAEIVSIKEKVGAMLLLDEAHALGVVGPQGRGCAAACGLEDAVDLQMGTFSKAVGLSGGYICGSSDLTSLLINKARSFVYSTAPSPALAATIGDVVDLVESNQGDHLRERLWSNIREISPHAQSAIVPIIVGENEAAMEVAQVLQKEGLLIPAIRYPTVAKGTARLRVTLSAAHRKKEIEFLKESLRSMGLLNCE